ncbi:DUF2106 family protein [Methanopyrus sp. KOL6]|uniref:DUF2106 family protein n=1 Tax=Methanopyrus sp. KOL6 TaxID=1937004 RepID=UPI000B4B6C5E|nr:DUF2106 family protein [Methanopyrus sp. KOL6]
MSVTAKLSRALNAIRRPESMVSVYCLLLAVLALLGLHCGYSYHREQLYPRPAPQVQMKAGDPLAPYDRGGIPLESPGVTISQYPQFEPVRGWVTSYLTPFTRWLARNSKHCGTTIVSHPGGILDEILYYTRGLDTVLESSIMFVAFVVFSWIVRTKTIGEEAMEREGSE